MHSANGYHCRSAYDIQRRPMPMNNVVNGIIVEIIQCDSMYQSPYIRNLTHLPHQMNSIRWQLQLTKIVQKLYFSFEFQAYCESAKNFVNQHRMPATSTSETTKRQFAINSYRCWHCSLSARIVQNIRSKKMETQNKHFIFNI